jgi:hypothetical protein
METTTIALSIVLSLCALWRWSITRQSLPGTPGGDQSSSLGAPDFFGKERIGTGLCFPDLFTGLLWLHLMNHMHTCRHAFLSNQKVQTPSTWGYRLVELIEAESAGIDNYDALGCRWAPQASGPTASGTSADSSSTAVHQNGSAPTGCKGEGGALLNRLR